MPDKQIPTPPCGDRAAIEHRQTELMNLLSLAECFLIRLATDTDAQTDRVGLADRFTDLLYRQAAHIH